MGWVSGVAIYVIIWWTVIFMVLPWGVRSVSPEDVERGHASSAPRRPRILLKMAVTTAVSGLVWLGVYAVIETGVISFSGG